MTPPDIKMEAIILAGGLGKRLRSVVPNLPKPMAPLGSRPFLEHQIDYWISQGIERFILSIGYKAELIQKHFGAHYGGAEIVYSVEEEPLGTGGALLFSIDKLRKEGPFLLLNGDTFFQMSLKDLQLFHRRKEASLTLALLQIPRNTRYSGVEMRTDGRVVHFNSRGKQSSLRLINGGIYLAERALFMEPPPPVRVVSLEDELLPTWLKAGERLYGFVSTGRFIDIGVPEDYFHAATMFSSKIENP